MRAGIYPYKPASASAKALAEALGVKRIKQRNSKFNVEDAAVINWGASRFETQNLVNASRLLNPPHAVRLAGNKLDSFNSLHAYRFHQNPRLNIPYFTPNILEASRYLMNDGPIMIRKVLTGHSGHGIIYCTKREELEEAPLYVAYIKKSAEFRVHVIRDRKTLQLNTFVQRKARKRDVPDDQVNWKVRNLDGGFIYANDPANVGELPDDLLNQAKYAIEALDLDFGAVDIIYSKKENKCYVLEVNTAPGLVGSTIEFYRENLQAILNAA